jgi:hypothetical protein
VVSATGGPRVSVAVAAYERSATLRCALASILAQTVGDFEVLVVGDATTDDSEAVVRGFGDPRLRFENLPRHTGHQARPNRRAIELARAPWIAYLGQDDLWLPAHLERLLACAERSAADFVLAGVYFAPPPSGDPPARVWGLAPWGELRADEHVPPSGWMHARSFAFGSGAWRPPEESVLPPDVEFLSHAREAGARFASTGAISVIKMSAVHRPGSYRDPSAAEQETWLARLASSPGLAEELAVEALRALQRRLPDEHLVDREALAAKTAEDWNRHGNSVRGLDAQLPTPPLDGERRDGRGPRLALRAPVPVRVRARQRFRVAVRIENRTGHRLASEMPNPVHLGYHWFPAAGGAIEGERSLLVPPLGPGESGSYEVRVVAPAHAGSWRLRLAVVQEGIVWFDGVEESRSAEVEVDEAANGGEAGESR